MGHKFDEPGTYASDKAPEDTYATTGATGAGTATGAGLGTAGAYDQPSGRAEDASLTGAAYTGTGSGRGYSGSGYQGDSYARSGAPEQAINAPGAGTGAAAYGAQPEQPVGGGYTGSGYERREGELGRTPEGTEVGEACHKPGMMQKVKACFSLIAVLLCVQTWHLQLLVLPCGTVFCQELSRP
jgi:hypothetical protein